MEGSGGDSEWCEVVGKEDRWNWRREMSRGGGGKEVCCTGGVSEGCKMKRKGDSGV